MPSHYLKQCWLIINWTLQNKLKWNSQWNLNFFIEENAIGNAICQLTAILSRPQRVKVMPAAVIYLCWQRWLLFQCSRYWWRMNTSHGLGVITVWHVLERLEPNVPTALHAEGHYDATTNSWTTMHSYLIYIEADCLASLTNNTHSIIIIIWLVPKTKYVC